MEQISLSNMPVKNQNSKIQINGIKSNVNNNKKFIYAYKKLIDSLNNLRHNKFDLKNFMIKYQNQQNIHLSMKKYVNIL